MEKEEKEKLIFEILRSECKENSTPIPNILFESKTKAQYFGFFVCLLSHAFRYMTETNGESKWKFDASVYLKKKFSADGIYTRNKLRSYLLECLQNKWIDSISKEGDSVFIIKINAEYLFGEIIKEK